ncbi:MAG: glutaredoxin family protein [Thermomonas sp.]|uniref:glutaredoxin family protein n=1 Tax=Thermomonas sp. TaxID=1971895 RepID=UPI001ED21BF4|nr:glutaredoxin family protein [Thermomonas sp.]MBV2208331.1 glutaredoxin family protein [Thermomonas sp.]
MGLILYQRDNCHLCDLALDVLAQAQLPEFDTVFIDDDDVLEASYGVRVPVLRDTQHAAELDWPFDAQAVRQFLGL